MTARVASIHAIFCTTIHAIFLLTVRRIRMLFSLKPSPSQGESSLNISPVMNMSLENLPTYKNFPFGWRSLSTCGITPTWNLCETVFQYKNIFLGGKARPGRACIIYICNYENLGKTTLADLCKFMQTSMTKNRINSIQFH